MKWTAAILMTAIFLRSASFASAEEPSTNEQRIAQLETDLKAALERIDALEKQLATMKPSATPAKRAAPPAVAVAPAIDDASWSGTLQFTGQSEQHGVTARTSASGDNQFMLHTEADNGAIWEWQCAQKNSAFQVVSMNRLRAAKGVAAPPGVGAITGGGTVRDNVITLRFDWPQSGNVLHGTMVLRKQ